MDIKALKARLAELQALAADNTITDDQVAELERVVADIETFNARAALVAKSRKVAGEIVDTDDVRNDADALDIRSIATQKGRDNAVVISAGQRALIESGDLHIVPTVTTVSVPTPKTPVLDALTKEIVPNGAVSYVVEDYTDAADVVAEGDTKPQASYSESEETIAIPTVAVHAAATRQALRHSPTLASKVTRLMNLDLVKKLEADAITAITGASGISTATGASFLTAARNAITKVEDFGYTPGFFLCNPADAAAVDIEVLGVTVNGPQRTGSMWGLPVVTSSGIAAGTGYVVDLDAAARLFTSGDVAVYTTDSHGTDFVENKIRVLVETEAVTAVVAPKAICSFTD